MAHIYRLIALLCLAWSSSAIASFPASSSGTSYVCTISSVASAPFSTPASACQSRATAVWGTYYHDYAFDCSGGTCQMTMYGSGGNLVGPIALTYTESGGSLSCPSNSTLSGSSCTCSSGYHESGSSCVADTPTAVTEMLEVPVGWVDAGGSNTAFEGPYTILENRGEPNMVCHSGFQWVHSLGTAHVYSVGETATNGHYPLFIAAMFTKTATVCGADTSNSTAPAATDTGGGTGGTGGTGTQTPGLCPGTGYNGTAFCPNGWQTLYTQSCYYAPGSVGANAEGYLCQFDPYCTYGSRVENPNAALALCGLAQLDMTNTWQFAPGSSNTTPPGGTGGTGTGGTWSDSACGTIPNCTGDAVQCAIARQNFLSACALKSLTDSTNEGTAEAALYDSEKVKTGDRSSELAAGAFSIGADSFDTSDALGGGSCIGDKTVTVAGKSITIPFSGVCSYLVILGNLLMALSALMSARIVVRG